MKLTLSAADRVAVLAVSSRLLQYPDQEVLDCLDAIDQAARDLPGTAREPLLAFVAHLRATPPLELQATYVETFDLRSRNCLYLTFPRSGDTRGRGMALWRFADLYRRHGYSPATGELPDFLPMLLEFAAGADPGDAEPLELLVQYRPEITLLRISLETDGSPYAGVVGALEAVLPKPSRAELEISRRLAEEGPPKEQVGIMPDIRWLTPEPPGAPEPAGVTEFDRDVEVADMLEARR